MMMIDSNIMIVRFFVGLDDAQYLVYKSVRSWRIEYLPSRCTVLPFTCARIFVSFSSHVSVCSLAYISHSCTGMALSVPDMVMLPSPVSPSLMTSKDLRQSFTNVG